MYVAYHLHGSYILLHIHPFLPCRAAYATFSGAPRSGPRRPTTYDTVFKLRRAAPWLQPLDPEHCHGSTRSATSRNGACLETHEWNTPNGRDASKF
jgi:hypothetical protein